MASLSTNFRAKKDRKSALLWIGAALLGISGVIGFSLYLPQSASAATITVNSPADIEADDGQCTLREAITAANTDTSSGSTPGECPAGSGADTVSVPTGTYFLSPGVGSTLQLNSEIELQGAGQNLTIIDGQGLSQIFLRSGPVAPVVIRDMSVQGGGASHGGAFYQSFGYVTTFFNVTFYNNSAVEMGGAITNSGGDLTLADCLVHFNVAEKSGGAIQNFGGTLTVIRTQFNHNSVDPDEIDGGGGAITSGGTGVSIVVDDSSFIGNSAAIGGAIYSQGPTTISGSTFSYNTSSVSPGVLRTNNLVMKNSTVSDNTNGGLTAGGVASWVLNSTFYDNNSGAANITKISGTLTIKNSVLLSFSGGTNCSGTITSGGYNIDNNSTCSFSATGDQSGVDPMLGQLLDNGGPTQTHALKYGSPAIDAGNPAGCTDDVGDPIVTDQRGWSRHIDGDRDGPSTCDIGAYERTIDLFLPLIMR